MTKISYDDSTVIGNNPAGGGSFTNDTNVNKIMLSGQKLVLSFSYIALTAFEDNLEGSYYVATDDTVTSLTQLELDEVVAAVDALTPALEFLVQDAGVIIMQTTGTTSDDLGPNLLGTEKTAMNEYRQLQYDIIQDPIGNTQPTTMSSQLVSALTKFGLTNLIV